jgi:hypothetical protein
MDWFLLLPALVCGITTYAVGHETITRAEQDGSLSWLGAALTALAAFSTLIAVSAVFP